MSAYLHTMQTLRTTSERYAIEEALQAATKDSERCQNYCSLGSDPDGVNGYECSQPGPFCLNDECGMCEGCSEIYSCPNEERHRFS